MDARRRQFTALFAGIAAAPWVASAQAGTETFPSRPVTLLLPFPAATTPDVVSRVLADGLAKELGQAVIIDNRGGAGGIIGTTMAARAPADGYMVLMGSVSTHAVNKALYKTLPYDPEKDFDPVVLLTKAPNTVLVNNELPVHTVPELIAYANANRGKVNFGSAGNGTSQHLAGEMFKSMANIELTHVPYKGGAAALTGLRSGQVQAMFEVLPSALPHITSNAVRCLAVTSEQRVPLLPDVPTVTESGLPGYVVTTWHGFFVPAHTPAAVTTKLNESICRVMGMAAYRQRIEALGFVPSTDTPDEFRRFIAEESKRWAAIVTSSGAHVD